MDIETIAQRYVNIYKDGSKEKLVNALNRFSNNYISSENFVLMFIRLTDYYFEKIKENPQLINQTDFLIFCYLYVSGKHIHILKGFGKAIESRKLIRKLKYENPKTISFYRGDMKKLHFLHNRRD